MTLRQYARAALGKKRRSASTVKTSLVVSGATLAGAAIAYAIWKALKTEERDVAKDVHVEVSIAIDKTPAELFAFWRDFHNLSSFMRNLISVTETSDRRSHWVARGLSRDKVEWDAEIFRELENELIAWRSLDTDIVHAGSVRFEQGPKGHGSIVRVTMNYNPPVGNIGKTIAQLLRRDPAHLIREDLKRLKQLLETGEIATITGQVSARTSALEASRATVQRDDPDHEKARSQPA
jgi:uncharacterized membrane protein